MVRHDCPIPEYKGKDYFVDVPERWLGSDYLVYEAATAKARAAKLPPLFHNFAVSLAIAHDWNLPGLEGKPEKWEYDSNDLEIMSWVIELCVSDLRDTLKVKKNYSSASGNHLMAMMKNIAGE